MDSRPRTHASFAATLAVLNFLAGSAAAQDTQKSREDMQRDLNAAVMATPFNPGDIKKAQAYAEEAKKQNVQPVAQPPAYWVPGWTCANMIHYAAYNYADYRGCVYHYHYYGRYWR
jgi:hypothetical protein